MIEKLVFDFVGTSGCGKTTIMKAILPVFREHGYSVNLVESSSRTMLKKFDLDLYGKTSDFVQCFISTLNWANILDSIRKYDVTLCTDLGIRSLVYTLYSHGNESETINAHCHFVDFFASKFFSAKIKPMWIYLPLEFEVKVDKDNEHRGLIDKSEHDKIDRITKTVLEDFDIPYYILQGSKEERCRKMRKFIMYALALIEREPTIGGHKL